MKTIHKTLLTLVALLTFWSVGSAQEIQQFKKHEISVGVAPLPFWAAFSGCDYGSSDDILEEIYGKRDGETRFIPLFSFAYNRYYKKWFSLNTRVSLMNQYNYVYSGADSHVDHLEVFPGLNIMEMAQFTFLNKDDVRLYAAAGLGLTLFDGTIIPDAQLTFFGVSLGKKVFGFAELGSGTEYLLVHGGIGYRF